ncbi:DNA mismatch repair protein MutT, partial [Rhizobium ruizarguesonis]
MTVWRPSQQIRLKVIGLAWRKDQLLAAEVEDDSGR